MGNQFSKILAGLLVLLLPVGVAPPGATAQPAPVTPPGALVGAFFAQLAALRGLPSPGSAPPVVVRSRSETRRYVQQELDRRYPIGQLEAERKTLVAWGLIPPDFDLRGFFLDLLDEQAAAYYDPVAKVMVLGDWLSAEQQQSALLHELVHALRDRQLSLDHFLAPMPGQGDELLARQALVEGEAVALSLELLLRGQGLDLDKAEDLSTIQQLIATQSVGPVFDRAPKVLKALLLFPYTEGLVFMHEFRRRQPWSTLDRLYADPPRSTTQILHPAKLVESREDPLPVTLPDLRSMLPSVWRRVDEDGMGEWLLGVALERAGGEAAGRTLAAGWRGDRYQVWESGGEQLLVYRVSYGSEEAADDFARAYGGLIEKKYPALAGKREGATSGGDRRAWQAGARRFLVERRGADVLVLEGVPAVAVEPIRQAVWAR